MPRRLTVNEVNYLNIGLMLASAALAFAIPFELFLFAYAVLGPLHYLTEISWLHDRKYFTLRERDYILLAALGLLAAADFFINSESFELATSIGIAGVGAALIRDVSRLRVVACSGCLHRQSTSTMKGD